MNDVTIPILSLGRIWTNSNPYYYQWINYETVIILQSTEEFNFWAEKPLQNEFKLISLLIKLKRRMLSLTFLYFFRLGVKQNRELHIFSSKFLCLGSETWQNSLISFWHGKFFKFQFNFVIHVIIPTRRL
jgi:hypothetical protein